MSETRLYNCNNEKQVQHRLKFYNIDSLVCKRLYIQLQSFYILLVKQKGNLRPLFKQACYMHVTLTCSRVNKIDKIVMKFKLLGLQTIDLFVKFVNFS